MYDNPLLQLYHRLMPHTMHQALIDFNYGMRGLVMMLVFMLAVGYLVGRLANFLTGSLNTIHSRLRYRLFSRIF